MNNKEFMLKLTALLDKLKSKKQINADIKVSDSKQGVSPLSLNSVKLLLTKY